MENSKIIPMGANVPRIIPEDEQHGSLYPYAVVRVMSAVYQKTEIPQEIILAGKERDWVKALVRRIQFRACLVLSKTEAEYYDKNGELEMTDMPPSGGVALEGGTGMSKENAIPFTDTEYVPKVGDVIYIDSALHLSHGVDDMVGGKARILTVDAHGENWSITVEGWSDTSYSWNLLAEIQESLQAKFGDTWAHKNPDYRIEFNGG